jgi:excisionase family DNA binding protein
MNTTYLSLSEVAQGLSLTRQDVRQLIKSGALPGYKFNREVKIRVNDLSLYVERSRIGGITDAIQKG